MTGACCGVNGCWGVGGGLNLEMEVGVGESGESGLLCFLSVSCTEEALGLAILLQPPAESSEARSCFPSKVQMELERNCSWVAGSFLLHKQ